MKILVTGVAGFVGSTLAERLLARGDAVVGLDNFHPYYSPARKRANLVELLQQSSFRFHELDFSDAGALKEIFDSEEIDCVAHMGAMANVRYSVENPAIFTTVNVGGTSNLLECCRTHGVDRFVFASTSSVYGQRADVPFYENDPTDRPLAPYPATKKAGELLGHAYYNMYGLNFTALRFFNVYGPRGRPDMMPYIVSERLLKGEEIVLFNEGRMHRDWTFVDDVVTGVVAAIDRPLGFQVLNIGRGEPVLMSEFMDIAQDIIGRRARIRVCPAPASEPVQTFASIERAEELLGYRPTTSLPEGFEAFWKWYQTNAL